MAPSDAVPHAASTTTDAAKPAPRLHTRIPADLLGRILDRGKASAYAVHLLAIKFSKGSGYVLNKRACQVHYGIGNRGFRAGLALLRKVGILDRSQPNHRHPAVETLAAGGERYVTIPDELLILPSEVLAFLLAVRLSPNVMAPAAAAWRIGINSRMAARRIFEAAKSTRLIADRKVAHGRIELARGGDVFDHLDQVAKNVTAKNVLAKNVTTYSNLKGTTEDCKRPQKPANKVPHSTRAPAERGASRQVAEEEKAEGANTRHGVDGVARATTAGANEVELAPWVTTLQRDEIRADVGLFTDGNNLDDAGGFITHDKWLGWLARCGDAPAHLKSPHAYREALSLANELAARGGVSSWQAMPGIAHAAMKALRQGRRVNSLGAIAARLIRKTNNGDYSWAFNMRSMLAPEAERTVANLALRWVRDLEAGKFPMHREALLGTIQVEKLHDCVARHGEDVVAAGLAAALKDAAACWPKEGHRVCAWDWFNTSIEAAAVAAKEAARARAPQTIWGWVLDPTDPRHLPRQAVTPGAAQVWEAKRDARRQREAAKVQAMQPLVDQLIKVDQAQLIAPAFSSNAKSWATKLGAFLNREGEDSMAVLVDLVRDLHVSELGACVRKVQGTKIYVQRWELLCDAVSAVRRQQKGAA